MAGVKYWDGINNRTIPDGSEGQQLTMTSGVPTWGAAGGSLALDDLTDVVITAAAQGELLAHNGTNWVDFAVGTSGQFLKTQGAGANPIWDTPAGATQLSGLTDVKIDTYANIMADTGATEKFAIDTDTLSYWVNIDGIFIMAVPGDGVDFISWRAAEHSAIGQVLSNNAWKQIDDLLHCHGDAAGAVNKIFEFNIRLNRLALEIDPNTTTQYAIQTLYTTREIDNTRPARTWDLAQEPGLFIILNASHQGNGGGNFGFSLPANLTGDNTVNPNAEWTWDKTAAGGSINWIARTRDNVGNQNWNNSGTAVNTGAYQNLCLKGKATTNWTFYIDGALEDTITTNMPVNGEKMALRFRKYIYTGTQLKIWIPEFRAWQKSV